MADRTTLPDAFKRELRRLVGSDRFLDDPESLFVYECDAITLFKRRPLGIAFPLSTLETSGIVRICATHKIPFTPRGAGTGLSGGALPAESGGILIDTSRMSRILEIDAVDRFAVVEPGLVNIRLSEAAAEHGLYYAPDPSSQAACTIGGNIAENSGGPHCLKHGATTQHVLGLTMVLSDGSVMETGGPTGVSHGFDLTGTFVGSEGTLGIVTRAVVRLSPIPDAVETLLGAFATLPDACRAVTEIISSGIMPAAIEALDRRTIEAVEASVFAAGYPPDAGAVLLVELDGHPHDVGEDRRAVEHTFQKAGCISFEAARDQDHRAALWRGRKGAFGAMGRIAPDLYVMDAVVPRSKLEEAIVRITEICDRYKLRIANVFHAGEGNLHPNICYDGRNEEEVERVLKANNEIVRTCLDLGGALSGEHGIGVEKKEFMPLLFSDADLGAFRNLRNSFEPSGLLNPGKLLPTPRACTEARKPRRASTA